MITLTITLPDHTAIAFAKFLESITFMAYKMTCSPGDNPDDAQYAGAAILRSLRDAGCTPEPRRKRAYPPRKWHATINEIQQERANEYEASTNKEKNT